MGKKERGGIFGQEPQTGGEKTAGFAPTSCGNKGRRKKEGEKKGRIGSSLPLVMSHQRKKESQLAPFCSVPDGPKGKRRELKGP